MICFKLGDSLTTDPESGKSFKRSTEFMSFWTKSWARFGESSEMKSPIASMCLKEVGDHRIFIN